MAWSLATTSCDAAVAAAWQGAAAAGRAALVPYVTAGYPDRLGSLALLRAAARHGDLVELGIPFSDPLADGPTIQRASFEALRAGMTTRGTLDLLAEARLERPVVLFSYLNPLLHYGVERFLVDAEAAGAAAVLITDLPAQSDPGLERQFAEGPLPLIRMAAPTTPPARLAAALTGARGFVYLVGRLGVTGARATLDRSLADVVRRVRDATRLPVAVGFGISTPAQAADAARLADGVVVGSAVLDAVAAGGMPAAEALLAALATAVAGAREAA